MGAVIVKVQSSLSSSDGVRRCLVYNKKRTIFYETQDQTEVKALLEVLKDRPKAYFSAVVNGKDDQGEKKIAILKETATQDW